MGTSAPCTIAYIAVWTSSSVNVRLQGGLIGNQTGIGVQCVVAKSFAFIYGRNQPTLGLLGITMRDPSFYQAAAVDGTEITVNVHGREIVIGEQKWAFQLDNLEIKMLQNKGLAEAYKKFGKNVFDSLCEDDREGATSEEKYLDRSLEW